MRKKNFISYCDTVFWYLIYLLPLIFFLCYLFVLKADFTMEFSDYMNEYFCPVENPIFEAFNNTLGYMNIISSNNEQIVATFFGYGTPVVFYLAYCATVTIAHVFFDVLVFIPRLAHKWLGKSTQQD